MIMVAAFGAADILFPTGNVRSSTIIVFALFVTVALTRGSWVPVAACLGWLFGFEVVLDVASLAFGRPATLATINLVVYAVVTVAAPVVMWRRGLRPSWPLLAAAAVVWMVWLATGLHVNQHTLVDFSPSAEVWNELSKTLWAAAYLVPFLLERRPVLQPERVT